MTTVNCHVFRLPATQFTRESLNLSSILTVFLVSGQEHDKNESQILNFYQSFYMGQKHFWQMYKRCIIDMHAQVCDLKVTKYEPRGGNFISH